MRVSFLAPARRELREAVGFYEAQRPGLGRASRDEVEAVVDRIKAFSEAVRL